jgi:hypothetical protein
LTGSAALLALALFLVQCRASDSPPSGAAQRAPAASWDVVYEVLQHPRCANCHPDDDLPKQGDDGRPHLQDVRGGPEGKGLFAMRCDTCHQTENLPGAHLPPGAPSWHLPHPDEPLVFAGRSSGELCRQLRDPAQNGGRTPEDLYRHVEHDPLVLWGWEPGSGRAPVATPRAEFLRAMRAWIDGGCDCPE